MDREEILEKSRRENREQDEMERTVRTRGESFSLIFALLTGLVLVTWREFHGQPVGDIMVMFWASLLGSRIYRVTQRRNTSDLVTLVLSLALFVYYLVQCFSGVSG